MPITINGRTLLRPITGTIIIWSAAIGAYVVVELDRTRKDFGDTKRDLAPSASFAAPSTADTGFSFPPIAETIQDQWITGLVFEKPKVTQRST